VVDFDDSSLVQREVRGVSPAGTEKTFKGKYSGNQCSVTSIQEAGIIPSARA